MKICKFETILELSRWAADFICKSAEVCIKEKGFFTIAFSGGSSPARLYSLLSTYEYASRMNWGKTYIFWSDERFVDHEDDDSNYKLVYEQLLSKASIRESHIFPIPVNGTPAEAAELYEEQIRSFFKKKMPCSTSTIPLFDVVLLGMGGDGHTASLFPKSLALDEKQKLVVAVKAPTYAPARDRISFTFKLINNAKDVLMLIPGKEKQKLVKQLVSGSGNIKIPAQMVRNTDNTYLLIDNDYS